VSHIQGAPLAPPNAASAPKLPEKKDLTGGEFTTVAILDSGIVRHPWLAGSYAHASLGAGLERWDLSGDELPRWAGHGTFVAGVVLQYAPRATILPVRVMDLDGEAHDYLLAESIRSLIRQDPDVLNLSLGPGRHPGEVEAATGTPQTNQAIADLQAACGTIVVVSGGYVDQPWPQDHLAEPVRLVRPGSPAALGGQTVIVGALDAGHTPAAGDRVRKASFSDERDVRLWAPGVGVSSSFLHWTGPVEPGQATDEPGSGAALAAKPASQRFDGWARWTGTSFAAPAVAGAVAAAISRRPVGGEPVERRLAGLNEVLDASARHAIADYDDDDLPVLTARSVLDVDSGYEAS
jgi:subtilisin family serine protease